MTGLPTVYGRDRSGAVHRCLDTYPNSADTACGQRLLITVFEVGSRDAVGLNACMKCFEDVPFFEAYP